MTDDAGEADAETVLTVVNYFGSLVVMGFGLLGAVAFLAQALGFAGAGVEGPVWPVVLFLAVFLAGAYYHPGIRRRLSRRRPVSRFGTVRYVDERVLSPDEGRAESCVACDETSDRGLIRRYREERVVAGVPVWEASTGLNFYCVECSSDETGLAEEARDADGEAETTGERCVERTE